MSGREVAFFFGYWLSSNTPRGVFGDSALMEYPTVQIMQLRKWTPTIIAEETHSPVESQFRRRSASVSIGKKTLSVELEVEWLF